MGNCWGSNDNKQTPSSTGNLTSVVSNTSKTTSITNSSIISIKSEFSVTSSSTEDITYTDGSILSSPNLRVFTFQELKNATKNFKPDCLLGEGGFGKVYKGWIDTNKHHSYSNKNTSAGSNGTGMVVAIKKLNPESCQGFDEWQSEVNFLGRLLHPNLVKLLGYCWEDEELLLVYEFMQRGSLENHLFGRGSSVQPLPWGLRLKIVIGAARGFAFLHSSDDRVIYRDIKAANILLDGSYNAKISDFGLAKLGPSESESHVTTRVMGSYGYAAPEYVATGHLYIKSDVYSFGVVLLEILTGERAHDLKRPNGKHSLVDWTSPYLSTKRKLKTIMDTRLGDKYPLKAAFAVAELASRCLVKDPKSRPSMQEVLDTLVKVETMDDKPLKVGPTRGGGRSVTGNVSRQNGTRPHRNL